jgi:acyl carrier protein
MAIHSSESSIEKRVFEVIAHQMGITVSDVSLTDDVNRLGSDSLDVLEIIMSLEEEFDLDISDEEAIHLKTVQSICDFVAASSVLQSRLAIITTEFDSGIYLHKGGVKGMRAIVAYVDALRNGQFFKYGGLIVASLKTGHLWLEMLDSFDLPFEISTATIGGDLSSLSTNRGNVVHVFLYNEPKKPKKKHSDVGLFDWIDTHARLMAEHLDGENPPGVLLFDCISHIRDTYVDNLVKASHAIKLIYAVSENIFQIKATSSVHLGVDASCDYEELSKNLPLFDCR